MPDALMNALVLHAVGDARYASIPMPEPLERQVRVRVAFCGICGSDRARFFGHGPHSLPLVCGHEFAGIVDQVGPGVTDFGVGERVAVFPLLWCGDCPPCEKGLYAQCLQYDYLGSRSNGALADFVIAPARNLIRVPTEVSLEEAAMTEPAAVALHAIRRAGGCFIGECVVVFGAGPIGLMVAQWARAMGAATIIFDIAPEALSLARRMGFIHVFDSRKQSPTRVVEGLTGSLGAKVCVDAVGVPETTLHCLQAARRNARVVLLGNPTDAVTLPKNLISQIMRREAEILGTWNSEYSAAGQDDDWHHAIAAMASGTINVKPLVTHRVRLRDAFDTLKMMRDGKEFYSKVLIYPES
jgi:L-iditol 2-dehydrogenase